METRALPRGGDGYGHTNRELRTRAVARHAQHRGVSIGSNGTQTTDAAIRDLSTHGCRIDSDAGWLRVGAFISIRPDEDAAVMGIVRWVRGGGAGIEFLHPVLPEGPAWRAMLDEG